jgi:hypothetical protein
MSELKNEHEGPISKEMLVKHLKTPPHFTIIRVNTVTTSKEILRDEIKEALSMVKINFMFDASFADIIIFIIVPNLFSNIP